jgi:hypothetical protein
MTAPPRDLRQMINEGRAVVREALARSHAHTAWDLLQERDVEGNAKGALPYTDHALAELAAAHKHDPDDIGVVHHLAIAHHARAWDMELRSDPQAAIEWERALGYWRTVAASAGFWAGLKDKLLACDPEADPAWLTAVRQNLLEDLLDIHVDFVRYYCEGDSPGRATEHVEIVKRASLPPAVKKWLVGKVYSAMTGAVPEAKAMRAYASALASIERFLALFPDYLPALRLYAEVCKDYLAPMSFQNSWDDIVRLGTQAEPYMHRLDTHAESGDDPLAQAALEELTFEFALRGSDRGDHQVAGRPQPLALAERDAARGAYEFAVLWGRLGYPRSPSGSQIRMVCAACLNDLAGLLHQEAMEVWESDMDPATKLAAMSALYRRAVADLEEAVSCKAGDDALSANLETLSKNLSTIEAQIAEIEARKNVFRLFGNLGGS